MEAAFIDAISRPEIDPAPEPNYWKNTVTHRIGAFPDRRSLPFVAPVLASFLLVSGGALFAQDSQVSGWVLDPTQAGVGSAAVVLTATGTGDRRQTTSNVEGYYTFPLLVPGVYDLTVQKDGFQSQTRKGIKVETGQISAVDVTLAVGEVSQSVSVDETVAAVAGRQRGRVGCGREPDDRRHAADRPAVDAVDSAQWIRRADRGRLEHKLRRLRRPWRQREFLHRRRFGGERLHGTPTLYFDPPVDAVVEFNVAVSNYAADLGRTGGGVFQYTTKSGTKSFKVPPTNSFATTC